MLYIITVFTYMFTWNGLREFCGINISWIVDFLNLHDKYYSDCYVNY